MIFVPGSKSDSQTGNRDAARISDLVVGRACLALLCLEVLRDLLVGLVQQFHELMEGGFVEAVGLQVGLVAIQELKKLPVRVRARSHNRQSNLCNNRSVKFR